MDDGAGAGPDHACAQNVNILNTGADFHLDSSPTYRLDNWY